ncbi:MAG: hypothetical protein JWO70_395 [Betaproteobacteria bacterium]|jgi:hypothetical protein|nr:hypothetical protein [Betaproteobacteria bacterium]
MGEWEFYRIPGCGADEPPFLWTWQCRHPDGNVVAPSETFRFLLDCVAHAKLHGYRGGPLRTRREPSRMTPLRGSAPALRVVSARAG